MSLKQFFNQLRPTSLLLGEGLPVFEDPSDISNLILWLAPDSVRNNVGGFPGDGVRIANWLDKSGEGNHAPSAGSPTWDADGMGSIGAAQLTRSTSDYFKPTMLWKNNMTTFIVAKQGIASGVRALWSSRDDPSGTTECNLFAEDNGDVWMGRCTTSAQQFTSSLTNNSFYITTMWNDTDDDWIGRWNGVEEISITHNGEDLDAVNNTPPWIGEQNVNGSPDNIKWDGHIAEVIMYDKFLSGEELTNVENYLADKYSIT